MVDHGVPECSSLQDPGYMYIYKSAGPSLEGPSGCEEYVSNCISTVFCYPFCNYLFFQSTSLQLPVCSLPVWYLIEEASKLKTGIFDFGVFLGPGTVPFTTHWVYYLNTGPSRVSLKNHQISSLSPRPAKLRKSEPKVTKRHQNVSQIPPTGHQISEYVKK